MVRAYSFKNFTELTEHESSVVLAGRNDEEVRKWMTSERVITLLEHRDLLETLKSTLTCVYLYVQRGDRFVGVYSLNEIQCGEAVGGFWISRYARQRLLALSVVFHSIDYVFRNFPIDRIKGYQLTANRPVVKLNAMLGFVECEAPEGADGRLQYLVLTKDSWLQVTLKNQKLMKLIEIAQNGADND